MLSAMIGGWLGEWITVTFASSLLTGVKSKLNPNDIVIGTIAVSYIAAEKLAELGKSSGEVAASVAQWISQHQDSEYVGNGIDALWDMVVGEQS